MAASTVVGAQLLSACAGTNGIPVVLGALEIGNGSVFPPEPHYESMDECLRDGQRIFDQYGLDRYHALKAGGVQPVSVAWRCHDWKVNSKDGFVFQQAGRVYPKLP